MPDKYPSMRALYADPMNVEGTTYGKRWKRHEWIQLVEAQAVDNPETEKVVLAIHGGGIEGGTSEVALAVAVFILLHLLKPQTALDCMTYGFLKIC